MRLNLWLICCLVCLLNSCGSAPKGPVCVSDPAVGGFDCYDSSTEKSYFVTYQNSDHYVALPPSYAQTLFDYCAQATK